MKTTIQITKTMEYNSPEDVYELKAWISETSNNLPSQFFCYQNFPTVPFWEEEGDTPEDIFVNVASMADIEKYPVDEGGEAPANTEGESYYRKNNIHLSSKSEGLLEEKWVMIKQHVFETCVEIARLNGDTLPREVEEIGL